MPINKKTINVFTCDICNNDFSPDDVFFNATFSLQVANKNTIELYKPFSSLREICFKCAKKIVKLVSDIDPKNVDNFCLPVPDSDEPEKENTI